MLQLSFVKFMNVTRTRSLRTNVISFFATHMPRTHCHEFTLLFPPQRLIILIKIHTRKLDR